MTAHSKRGVIFDQPPRAPGQLAYLIQTIRAAELP